MKLSPSSCKLFVFLWVSILLVSTGYCVLRISSGNAFENDILNMLPNSVADEHGWNKKFINESGLQKAFVILLQKSDQSDEKELVVELKSKLAALSFLELEDENDQLIDKITQFYKPYRQQLLTTLQRSKLKEKDAHAIATEAYHQLFEPIPSFKPFAFEEDPFNLSGDWLKNTFLQTANIVPGVVPSIKKGNQRWYLLKGELKTSPFNSASQEELLAVVNAFKLKNPSIKILTSGTVFHAAEVTKIARHEVSTVGLGSLLGIIALVVVTFRSKAALFAISFTLTSSFLVALTLSLVIFGEIHLITLAFGCTLLGLAVDYCFHFLLNYRRYKDALTAGRVISRGLLISASSSIFAYLIQIFSPFPGLQQFAVFVSSGLVGACITVMVMTLWYQEPQIGTLQQSENLFYGRYFKPVFARFSQHKKLLFIAIVVSIPLLLFFVTQKSINDDIRILNTSSDELVDNEKQVKKLIGSVDAQRYWLVEGKNEQKLLVKTENAVRKLQTQFPVLALVNIVPSLQQQKIDHQIIYEKIYAPGAALDQLCILLASECELLRAHQLTFLSGLEPSKMPKILNDFYSGLFIGNDQQALIFPYQNTGFTEEQLASIEVPEDTYYIDHVKSISDSLSSFRSSVTQMLGVFLLIFLAVCFYLYKQKGLLMMACIFVPIMLGLIFGSGQSISLFHILALLLVLGISMDTVIFYLELGLNEDTWLASTLSMLTSILAFGLLALSQVPVLHQFGSVVFFGLLSTWLITPILYQLLPKPMERVL